MDIHEPTGKNIEYWQNRAVRAEVELYALRQSLFTNMRRLSLWEQIKQLLSSGS